jgi:succinate-semialdehyde dehydrogenase/glutarate-semialdehyde dehydrogenase
MPIATTDPTTGQVVQSFVALTPLELDDRLQCAADAYVGYRRTSIDERAGWLRATADLLEAEADSLAATMTLEMGKLLSAARAEVMKCARGCRFYADHAKEFLADEPADAGAVGATRAFIRYDPLGPVLAVMPWNFPMWQAMRFAAPALMAGNVGLLKHSSNVPLTALAIESLFRRGGFPEGVFQTLLIGSAEVATVIGDPRVAAATVTGSEGAGRAVASVAGQHLKPSVLELGGSDPFIVLPSADLAEAAQVATVSRCQNNGQSCIAAKRFIVHTDVYEEFAELFVDNMRALVVGSPVDPAVDVGPLATEQGRTDVHGLVTDALSKGASLRCGGVVPSGAGWFYPPTVIADITPDMRLFHEETFGPVAALYRVDSVDDALSLANATAFGLGANVWSRDPEEQERCISELESGAVFVQGMTTSYPELPFGGIKLSGYGRELSAHGMRAFCNLKTVWVR